MKENKPVYKKWWFWVVIVLIILALIPKKSSSVPEASQDPLEELLQAKVSKTYNISNKDGYIEIDYVLENLPYNQTDYVSKALTHFVIIGDYVFDNGCSQLRMDMKDDSGIITSLIMTKANFESISWNDIAFTQGIYADISSKFDKFYVESMLMKDVDTNEIMFKATLGE